LRKATWTSGERLQRRGQTSPTGTETDKRYIANLIVIGGSAGGHRALVEILKNVSADMPAAIVILLHTPLGCPYSLKESLGRFSRFPIVEVVTRKRLQQGFIFIPPPGRSVTVSHGMIKVEHGVPQRPVTTINRLFTSGRPELSRARNRRNLDGTPERRN
jgi:chemotaxis response regulator CheB